MSPARRSAPAVLRLLGGLTLLLLLCPPAARGDCGPLPDVPNAHTSLGSVTRFPEQETVTYKCNEGFVKVPGKPDSVICVNNQWTEVTEFCNRSCDVPPRLLFASLQEPYSKQNYFPEGSTVKYECRKGYKWDYSLSGTLICLPDFTWSKPAEFCKKKSCPNPGEIPNGHVSIQTGILFGASIFFSCNTGYKLDGVSSSFCALAGETVEWSDPLPECKAIACPKPPEIDSGTILEPRATYVYRESVTYKCEKGFTLVGESSIYCTVKDDQGEWSGPPPECKDNSRISKVTSTVQNPTTVHVTETPPASQNPIVTNASATQVTPKTQRVNTQSLPATQKSTPVHASVTKGFHTTQRLTSAAPITAAPTPAVPRATTRFPVTTTSAGRGTLLSGAVIIASGKFGSPAVKRNCHHCGMYNPYSWKRILSFNCLRNTIKMQCLWVPKRKQVNAFYRRVLWTPLGTRYVPKYSQPCSCSKVILGQLQIIWPINQVLLRASCFKHHSRS
ncbi:complement decay-accelerating factor isoform X2 [Diceros bicornis minor]|uniref:complement decay-accelerating factor isoform X2 n=1 Tax=Diceros bicornis minor TaxID=77932 RepID=UPI0026EE4AD4|nr:complement decay-accelerating factor isoform X2 [Diceros bicornis minor]